MASFVPTSDQWRGRMLCNVAGSFRLRDVALCSRFFHGDDACVLEALKLYAAYAGVNSAQRSKSSVGYGPEHLQIQQDDDKRRAAMWEIRIPSKLSVIQTKPCHDTLLSSPGSLSADSERGHLFIADTNHHRIIITDGDGRVLDFIGSSVGVKDGTFETAQLQYPASTVFDADNNHLYIADSMNHVVRRADLSKRIVNSICPQKLDYNETLSWNKISVWMQQFGLATPKHDKQFTEQEIGEASEDIMLKCPWHLRLAPHGQLVVANQGFDDLWVLNPDSGDVTKVPCQGSEMVFGTFLEKSVASKDTEEAHKLMLHLLNKIPAMATNLSRPISVMDMISRVAILHKTIFLIDTESRKLWKMNTETRSISTVQFANLSCLGLPWWWSIPSLNLLSSSCTRKSDLKVGEDESRYHDLQVQPGRCLICLDLVLPEGLELASPLEDSSIWRQARGSVVELSILGGSLRSHKVSGAQQWVDDLEDLDSDSEDNEELSGPQQCGSGLPFYLLVDTSPGTGEVFIDAVLYLKHAVASSSATSRIEFRINDFVKQEENEINTSEGPNVLSEWIKHQDCEIYVRHLRIRVNLDIRTTAQEERTKHIKLQL